MARGKNTIAAIAGAALAIGAGYLVYKYKDEIMENIGIGEEVPKGVYRHYKGKEYEVLGVAKHCDTLEDMVVYKALYRDLKLGKNPMFVRPKNDFLDEVELDDGEVVPRFEYIDDEE